MMQTYDTHAHLDHLKNLPEALSNAAKSGVLGIVALSMDLESCRKNLHIKENFHTPKIFLGFGMHPSEAKFDDLERIVDLIHTHRDKLHLIGEIGLDFWYKWVRKDDDKKNEQRRVYKRLLQLAKELDLPAVIHSRGAWKECLQIALELGVKRAEFHWYSGPLDVLEEILNAGFYVSTSPSVAYSPQSQEAMRFAPIERTLIETDSPVFYKNGADEQDKGFSSEPKDVFRTLDAYCALKAISKPEALRILNKNAEDFFNLN